MSFSFAANTCIATIFEIGHFHYSLCLSGVCVCVYVVVGQEDNSSIDDGWVGRMSVIYGEIDGETREEAGRSHLEVCYFGKASCHAGVQQTTRKGWLGDRELFSARARLTRPSPARLFVLYVQFFLSRNTLHADLAKAAGCAKISEYSGPRTDDLLFLRRLGRKQQCRYIVAELTGESHE